MYVINKKQDSFFKFIKYQYKLILNKINEQNIVIIFFYSWGLEGLGETESIGSAAPNGPAVPAIHDN